MKRKVRIGIIFTLIITTLLSLMISVNAATGGFDTIDMRISPVSEGGSSSSSSKGKNMWYMSDSFNTGTRYVLRIDGEEVPEQYYINHLNNGNFYSGTNVLKSGKLNNSTWKSHSKIAFSSEYNHVTNWRNGIVTNFGFSNNDTLAIVNAVKALATKANDTEWINKTNKVYDTTQSVEIEIRAEILIEARTAEDAKYYYMTYNEIRKTGMYSGDLEQMGYIRDQRGLDAIACKLYEKDDRYSLKEDGSVNCSCNYLKAGGTNLAPLLSSYSYTFIEGDDANITLDYNGQSSGKINYSTGDGFVRLNDGTSRYYGGNRNLQVNMLMPNICSMRIGGKYYTPGMGKHSGYNKAIADGMYFTPARLNSKSKWDKFYVKFPVYVRYSVSVPGFNSNTAYVFEGWDYIVSTRNVEIIETKEYTVVEKWVELGNENNNLQNLKSTTLQQGATYTVSKPAFDGYTYNSSNPAVNSFTVSSNTTIIHYYNPIELPRPDDPEPEIIYGRPVVTKDAEWIEGTDKTEAEITITVKAEVNQELPKGIASSDIIYLLDKSNSMGKHVDTSFLEVRDATINRLNCFLTGEYAGANNRVAFASFSSNLYTYGKEAKDEYEGRVRTNYARPGTKQDLLKSTTDLNYSTAKDRIFERLNKRADPSDDKKYTAYFYTSTKQIENVIGGLKKHKNPGENSNFDLPLFYAQWLLENRPSNEQSRKPYIILITEGEPYPTTDYYRAFYGQKKDNDYNRNADYVANKFYAEIAEDLRETYGAEIYAVVFNRDKKTDYSMLNAICGYKDENNDGVNDYIFKTPDTVDDANDTLDDIHTKIAAAMQSNVKYADVAPMTLTDIINPQYFELISTDASKTCSVNVGETKIKTFANGDQQVIWDLGKVTYNKKCEDGNWPTLKIRIRLKDDSIVGNHLETNDYIPDENEKGEDQCILEYPDGEVPTPTPWLDRDNPYCNVKIQYINEETKEVMKEFNFGNIRKNTYWPVGAIIPDDYAVPNPQQFDKKWKGYELNTEKVYVSDQNPKEMPLDAVPNALFMNSDKEIKFYYNLQPAKIITTVYNVIKENDEVVSVKQIGNPVEKQVKVEKETTINKPSKNPTENSAYIGSTVYYNTKPFITNSTVYNGLTSDAKVEVKIPAGQSVAYVIFVYEENSYRLTVKFQDLDGNPIKPDIGGMYPAGEEVPIKVPTIPGYEFHHREDIINGTPIKNPDSDEPVIMNETKIVILKYEAPVNVKIEYRDAFDNTPIAEDKWIDIDVGKGTDNIPTKAEVNVPDEYIFSHRTGDNKPNEDDDVGPVYEDTTVILWYGEKSKIKPVVSFPGLSGVTEKDGKNYVVLGDTFTVETPNKPEHIHKQVEIDLGGILEKPSNGWNSVYAKRKYIVAECDVYYNGILYPAGNPIQLNGDDDSADLLIPEWVEEEQYDIYVYVSSDESGYGIVKEYSTEDWNELYSMVGAVGKVTVEVIGKVYDFTITNLVEEKNYWPATLFGDNIVTKSENGYRAGLGEATITNVGLLPIGQGTTTQQPSKYNHGISLGSTFYFNVNTLGKKNAAISIKPKFMYVTKDGAVKPATLYSKNGNAYEEIKEGQTIQMQVQLNNEYKKIRTNLNAEIQKALGLEGFKTLQTNSKYNIGNYGRLLINKTQRVPFVEYIAQRATNNALPQQISNIYKNMTETQKDEVLKSACHWYGEYSLPASTIVMEGTSKPGQGTQYKDGFVVVMFQIETQNEANSPYLLYNNQAVGNQWDNERLATGTEMKIRIPRLTGTGEGKEVPVSLTDGYYPVAIYDVAVRGNRETAGTH